ncbi:uncharacterized protein LOC143018557 isoform X2 [Oratosquilla oratoria]|uniref:uncharacterized protein LOC143018557 isoform X2 n=1 Tax=Oratosquilla oratoria TaxID=337810 RepID=UPI003F7631A8
MVKSMTNSEEDMQNCSTSSTNSLEKKREDYLSWDDYFMSVAFLSAMRSKDPCSQVGACIISDEKKIVAIGYNGMPRGCEDDEMPWGKGSDNCLENKSMYVCHAEMNAILNKNSADVKGCTIYVALFPCNECAKLIIQARIKEVIYMSDKYNHKLKTKASKRLMDMTQVKYRQYTPSRTKLTIDFATIDDSLQRTWEERKLSSSKDLAINNRNVNKKREDYLAWEEYFMAMAFLSAMRSKDPNTQVGAIITNKENKVVGIGYNGMPVDCSDDLLPWGRSAPNKFDTKYMYVCHAEMNAIMNKNCADVSGCTMYVALFPCNECAKLIIQSGIKCVNYFSNKHKETDSVKASMFLLEKAGVLFRQYSQSSQKIVIDFEAIDWNRITKNSPDPEPSSSLERDFKNVALE